MHPLRGLPRHDTQALEPWVTVPQAGFRTNQSLGNTSTAITKIAIERLTMGLPMFVPGAQGACSPTSLEGVPYGYDAVSQCALSLTANDLRDYCK